MWRISNEPRPSLNRLPRRCPAAIVVAGWATSRLTLGKNGYLSKRFLAMMVCCSASAPFFAAHGTMILVIVEAVPQWRRMRWIETLFEPLAHFLVQYRAFTDGVRARTG